VRTIEMTWTTRIFDFLSNPQVAFLLFMAGALGLYTEFNSPGLLLPGIAGAVCLLLAAIAFQILPFSWVGMLLLVMGMGLIVAELFVSAFGVLFTLGLGCMLVGGSLLFEMPEVSDLGISFWSVLVPVVGGFGVFAAIVIVAVGRTIMMGQTAGVSELIGMVGRVSTRLAPDGKVFIRGEYWNASADEEIAEDERVEVTAVEGLRMRVRRVVAGR
jgi:membrane-bound serine protease (ClpP class)